MEDGTGDVQDFWNGKEINLVLFMHFFTFLLLCFDFKHWYKSFWVNQLFTLFWGKAVCFSLTCKCDIGVIPDKLDFLSMWDWVEEKNWELFESKWQKSLFDVWLQSNKADFLEKDIISFLGGGVKSKF